MPRSILALLLASISGCAQLDSSSEAGNSLACGRIRLVADGEEVRWGATFDRPTPELYHVESRKVINRIALSGGLFTEAVERDGTFCWQVETGSYFISRIVPFQGNVTTADDPRKNVFPGIAFRVEEKSTTIYLGTLQITGSVRRDALGNRWLVGKPSIEVLDDFDRDHAMAQPVRTADARRRLMVRVPALEGVPFHPAEDTPALLRAIPWFLLTPR